MLRRSGRATTARLAYGQPAPASASAIAAAGERTRAFPLPAGSKDAALLLTLPPGASTAVSSAGGGASGEVLIEAYEVP